MVIEKVFEIKDKEALDGIYENTLFLSIEQAVKLTGLAAEDFIKKASITFNDGDNASVCKVEELIDEYKKMLTVEPDEIDGIPRKDGEAYFQTEDKDLPVSLPLDEIIKILSE